jgi:hypothetical protein
VNWLLSPTSGSISASGLYTAPAALTHQQTVQVTATNQADATQVVTAQITLLPGGAFQPVRINCGGPDYTDGQGRLWSADRGFAGGFLWSTAQPVSGTTMSPVLQTVRYGQSFSYTFDVAPGSRTVNLYFAEVSQTARGARAFNVSINGSPILTNFDVFAASGGPLKGIVKSFPVNAAGGTVQIQFSTGAAGWPMVSAVEID